MAFRDKYTDFTFDDKKSSSYKVWITNKNDIQLALTPNFKDKFTSPQFGGVRYLDGTTIEKTDIKISCIAIDVTLNEWRAICNWLGPTKIGKLSFDFNHYTYYNAKLSSNVTAKMFNYSGKDSLLGGRKIIEFSLSFTTVGDYAAMGLVNTGLINFERVSTDIDATAKEMILRSTNNYHMPCIMSDTPYVVQYDYVTGLDLKLNNNNCDLLSWAIGDLGFNGSTYYQLLYNNSQWSYIIAPYKATVTESEYYYNTTHKDNHVSVLQQNAELKVLQKNGSAIESVAIDQTGFNIFNIGEYESYPRIKLNNVAGNFEVWLDDTLYYRYVIASDRALNNIVIDCQSGTITYNGRFLDNAVDAFGYNLVNSSYNLGPLAVPSGNPEIHLAKLKTATNENINFILAEPMISSYHDSINLGVTITRNLQNSVKYGEDLYGSPFYEPHSIGNHSTDQGLDNTSFYQADVHSYVTFDSTDDRKVTIQQTPSKISAGWNGSAWVDVDLNTEDHEDQLFYVSFCEGHRLTIKVNDTVPSNCYISMQSRGAI